MEVWPGVVSTIRYYDEGFLLCLDVSHRVLRKVRVDRLI